MTASSPSDGEYDIRLEELENALSTLGNDVRISILHVFFNEITPGTVEPHLTLSFSELCERADVSNSSQFAYHLEKLTGQFLRKTDTGYALTYAGIKLLRAIHAGMFTESINRGPLPLTEPCPKCKQTSLEARSEANYVEIYCTANEWQVGILPFPPTGLQRDNPKTFLDAFSRYHRSQLALAADGICPECGGSITSMFERRDKEEHGHEAALRLHCEICGWWRGIPPLFGILEHPIVIGFYADHGVNIRNRPVWYLGDNWDEQIVAEEPISIEVRTELEGDELRLVIDDELRVHEIERSTRDYGAFVEDTDESSN